MPVERGQAGLGNALNNNENQIGNQLLFSNFAKFAKKAKSQLLGFRGASESAFKRDFLAIGKKPNRRMVMNNHTDKFQQFLAETEDLAARINPLKTDNAVGDMQDTVFEALGAHPATQAIAYGASRKACEKYEETYGEKPNAFQLAMAHKAMLNILENKVSNPASGQLILENEQTSTQDIPVRNIFLGMILPATLMSITSRLTTPFPSNPDKADIYRMYIKAASNWNGYSVGDVIDEDFAGGYGNMDLYESLGTGNGALTNFNSTTGYNLVRERVYIMVDMSVIGKDDGNGNISGTGTLSDGTSVSISSGTVNYTTGQINVTFSAAVPNTLEVEAKVDVDIEANPDLIPKIKYDISKFEVYPHESVLGAQYTLQAMLNLSRNYGQNMASVASRHLLNLITANTDRVIIRDMYKGAIGKKTFDATVPAGISVVDHYPTVTHVLDEIDQALVARNKKAGLFAMVCGQKLSRFFRAMTRMGLFQLAAGYRSVPQPHFVGRINGIEIYEDPQLPEGEGVAIAKGADFFRTGYYSSIAVPYMPFRHSVQEDLRYKSTLYGKQFRDFAPIDGRKYFMRFELLNF